MSTRRMTRVNELIRRELGEALFRLMHENTFDLSAVTITHVITSANLRHARVLVSIRDHQNERARMMNLIRHHRAEMQDRINKNLGLKYTPKLIFELDTSIERGDRVLDILSHMDGAEEGLEPPAEPQAAPEPARSDADEGEDAPDDEHPKDGKKSRR